MKTNKTIMVRWAIALICICGLSAEGCCECLSEPAREIKEELDTVIKVERYIDTIEYDYPEFHLSMDCFLCTIVDGDLVLKEHEAARWLTKDTLDSVDWLPADVTILDEVRSLLGS